MYGVRSAEQQELAAAVRKLLQERSSESAVRATMDAAEGYDRELATLMAEQMGLHGIAIPEEYGGAGFGFLELSVILDEMGRALVCGPFFSSVVLFATALLESGDDDACRTWLPQIAAGRLVGTAAIAEDAGGWDEQSIRLAARREGEHYLLSGRERHVLDGASAEAIVVAARLPEGVGLFIVDTDLGLRRTAVPTLDRTRRQATLDFADTPARLLAGPAQGRAVLRRILDRAAVALACEQVGGAERVLEMAVGYAKTRHQFDRPIGSFQAIKHTCADMLVAVESARSAARCAAEAVAANDPDLELLAGLAKTVCSETFSLCARDNIQIHGGIGFTWEHPAHLYYKRAKSGEAHFGTPRYHRERLALRTETLPA